MTRWDSPLFTVPYKDENPPFEDIWEAMIGSEGKAKVVKPNQATVMVTTTPAFTIHPFISLFLPLRSQYKAQKPSSEPDYLYELDRITQEVVNVILEWQKDHPGEGGGEIPMGNVSTIQLPPNPVSLPQLQRIRRQFISLNRQHDLPKSRIRTSFVEFLEKSL